MNNKHNLMKHFSSVLRKRSTGEAKTEAINPSILKYFKRKELIEIIANKYGGSIPKQHNLVELENEELLCIIGDELFILFYVTGKWAMEITANLIVENATLKKEEKPKDKKMETPKSIGVSKGDTSKKKP